MKCWGGKRPAGITVLEALLATVVLAAAAATVIMPFAAGARCTAEDARLTVAVDLAEALMEEILSKPFSDPNGSEAGETGRSNWDDMDDYNGYSEGQGQISSFDGVAVDDSATVNLTRQATVQGVYVAGQDTGEDPTFLRITVEVKYRGETVVELSRLAYANE